MTWELVAARESLRGTLDRRRGLFRRGHRKIQIFFEKTKIQDRDTLFHPLPRSTLWTEAAVACARIGAEGGTVRAFSGCAERVQIGSGKFFRPTKGLCALFRRTGTRRSPIITKPPPAAYTTPSRPSFADVVRAGKQMAAQGSGHGGDHGARGGGRGRGTTPGFTRVST